MNFKYYYHAFGLNIASQLLLPELPACSNHQKPDVHITIGKIPQRHDQGAKDSLVLFIKNVGSYLINRGKEIVAEPVENGELDELRLFLLGSAFGALLLQRRILPIHGSAVKINEQCFIIAGPQGTGKSTLAAAFAQDGYEILTDDIAAVFCDSKGMPWVYPSYPQQKLWKDSLEYFGNKDAYNAPIIKGMDKYAVPLDKVFCHTPQRLSAVFEVRKGTGEMVMLSPLSGADKLGLLLNNIYRKGFADVMGLKDRVFLQAAGIADKISVYRVIRPEGLITIQEEKKTVSQFFENGRCLIS